MKKLLSFLAAGALAFGLIGCSGDLHDVPDPNSMEGNWFYSVVDVSGVKSGETISIIFNDGSAQTNDIKEVDPTKESVAYVWTAVNKTDAIISARTDCPDKSSEGGDGKLVVYCFSNAAKLNSYIWDSAENKYNGDWPGKAMQSDTAAALPTATIDTITITGLPAELESETLYLAGSIQPTENWTKPGENSALKATIEKVADGTCTLTFSLEHTYDAGSYEFKFASANWTTPEVCVLGAENKGSNISVTLAAGNTKIKGVYSASDTEKCVEDKKYCCTFSVE